MFTKERKDLKTEFETQGYVILREFFSQDEMSKLAEEIASAGKLVNESGLSKGNLIFYNNVFKQSAYIQSFICQEKIIEKLSELIGPDFWVRWDQCVVKGAGGGAFPWHQDNAYNRLKDRHYQFWIGISDMTKENGGLWLQPGSHRNGLLPHKLEGNHLVCTVQPVEEVFISAKIGDVIIFSSMMLHHTKENQSESDRWAYVVEYMLLDHYDPYIEGPFFVAAENGIPVAKFVDTYRGHSSFKNRAKYFGSQIKQTLRQKGSRLKKMIKGSSK